MSTPGVGSIFSTTIPVHYMEAIPAGSATVSYSSEEGAVPVLVVEDDPGAQIVYDRFLRDSGFQSLLARSLREARLWLKQVRPAAIVLDLMLQGEDSWKFLAELKSHDETASIPVVVISTIDDQRKGLALGADAYALKPIDRDWLLRRLGELTVESGRAARPDHRRRRGRAVRVAAAPRSPSPSRSSKRTMAHRGSRWPPRPGRR